MPNYDFYFSAVSRDLTFQPDGEPTFVTDQSTLSTQCASILLLARCMNVLQPAAGIGFSQQIIGSDIAQAALQLNRLTSQISIDGGAGSWVRIPAPQGVQFDFSLSANYELPTA